MVAPPRASFVRLVPATGLRHTPFVPGQEATGQGLQYKPMSPWRSAASGGLQGLGSLLMALATGNQDQAAAAFQAGLQGQQEADYRRAQQARDDELFQMRRDDLAYERQSKEEEKAAAAAERAVWETQVRSMGLPPEREAFILAMGPDSVDYGDLYPEPEGPQSSLGKLAEDLRAGRISQAEYNAALQKETYIPPREPKQGPVTWSDIMDDKGNIIGQRSSTGEVNYFSKYPGQQPEGPKPSTPAELRGEYGKATKEYEQALVGFNKVMEGANNPSAAGDIALIFGFMKTLDPNSTVREGEFATAQNAGSVPQSIAALYNRIMSGERLTQSQRSDFATQARNQFSVYEERKKVADQFYTGVAERNQVSPQDVLIPYGEPQRYLPPSVGGPDDRETGASGASGDVTEGTIIVNPTTKERLMLKGGQWVPVGGGR